VSPFNQHDNGIGGGVSPEHLDPGVVSALVDPGKHEGAPRRVSRGRAGVLAALAADALCFQSRREVLRCADEAALVIEYAETSEVGRSASSVIVCGLTGTSITSIVNYRHQLVPMVSAVEGRSVDVDTAIASVWRYLTHLEAGRTSEASAQFSVDAIYSFPPRQPGQPRGIARGREAIEAAFIARGVNSARHQITRVVTSDAGPHLAVLGRVTGLADGRTMTFASCVTFARDGLIARYMTQSFAPEAFAP
jgi:hypothetical protein